MQVVAVTLLQTACAVLLRDAAWWKVFLAAYTIGGTLSQNLFTAQHELSHFLAFKTPVYNKVLSLASNCPLVVPMATSFRKYHQEHHSHLARPPGRRCAGGSAPVQIGRRSCPRGRPGADGALAQGVDGWDVDLPSYLEASYVCTTLTKALWVFVYIAVYGVRPLIVRPKPQGAPLAVQSWRWAWCLQRSFSSPARRCADSCRVGRRGGPDQHRARAGL